MFCPIRFTYSSTTGSVMNFVLFSISSAYCLPILISPSVEYQLPSPRPPMLRLPTALTSSMLPGLIGIIWLPGSITLFTSTRPGAIAAHRRGARLGIIVLGVFILLLVFLVVALLRLAGGELRAAIRGCRSARARARCRSRIRLLGRSRRISAHRRRPWSRLRCCRCRWACCRARSARRTVCLPEPALPVSRCSGNCRLLALSTAPRLQRPWPAQILPEPPFSYPMRSIATMTSPPPPCTPSPHTAPLRSIT